MKNRSKLFYIFQTFYEIKTQFGFPIQTLWSDNDREYISNSFKQFMVSHAILYKNSCVYTPQQNKVAKCNNIRLIETTLHSFNPW